MALRVWLPLNGNLNNQGLSNIQISNTGAIINNAGKIGKAYEFGASHWLRLENYAAEFLTYKEFTLSVWFKCTAQNTSHGGSALISGGNWNSAGSLLNLALGEWKTDHYSRLLISGSGTWGNGYDYNFNLNTWYHVALTSGNGKMRAYVNGELIGDSYSAFTPASLEQDWICIGNGTYYSGFIFNGLMNDVRIYDECLSPKQVKEISKGLVAHYKMSNYGINDNLATDNPLVNSGATSISYDRYTHTYTIVSPVGDSTWGYGLKIGTTDKCLVPWNSNYRFSFEVWVPTEHEIRVDYNNYANTGSSWNGNDNDLTSARYQDYARTVPGQTWTKLIFGSKNAHTGNTDHVDIYEVSNIGLRTMNDTGPVTWYLRNFKFELGDTVTEYVPYDYKSTEFIIQDCSGYGYNGVKTGTLTSNLNSPRYDNSMAFSSAIVNSASCAALANSKDFTINGWFYHVSGTNYYASAESYNTSVCLENGRFFVYPASGGAYVGNWSATDNVWQMLTLVHDCTAKTLTLYVNGAQCAQITTNGTVYPNNTLNIGGRQNTAGYTGSMSDFRVYVTALSAEDIKELYQTSAIVDNQGNSYACEFKEE